MPQKWSKHSLNKRVFCYSLQTYIIERYLTLIQVLIDQCFQILDYRHSYWFSSHYVKLYTILYMNKQFIVF